VAALAQASHEISEGGPHGRPAMRVRSGRYITGDHSRFTARPASGPATPVSRFLEKHGRRRIPDSVSPRLGRLHSRARGQDKGRQLLLAVSLIYGS
jgi:hypothetical protein